MNYEIINSGSDGNCTIIGKIIAIDMGVSIKKLGDYANELQLVLLTHCHQDHINKATITKLAKNRPTLRFGCCEWLVSILVDCGVNKRNIDVFEIGKKYDYGLFYVVPIKLYHDVDNCGYRLFIDGKKIIYATDTKTLDGITAKNYDYYFIEANYENEEELHNRAYNTFYESRVKETHLSKEYTINWLLENMSDNSIYHFMHTHKDKLEKRK